MSKLMQKIHGGKGKNKRVNHTKYKEELEWIDFDEAEDDYYEDEEEEFEEENYYESDEEDLEYEEDEGCEEEYYEEDEYYEDDEDGEDDGYYEDDEYYEEDEDDEDEYYEDDDEDEYYEDDEAPDGVLSRIVYKITNMSLVDHIVAFTGAAVLILAVATGVLYLNARSSKQQVEAFAEVGAGMEDMGIIGESGLLAIADAQAAKLMAADLEEEESGQNAEGKIEVAMDMTSIQKDLKIKFINKGTGKLISNIRFTVEIEKPSGGTYTKEDDDKDGIIYQTELKPGKYQVRITSPSSDDEYSISSETVAITVRDTIEYKKVDVSNEIKTEAQVNVAKEDTKVNETAVESVNTDTVEWVESTKTVIEGTERNEESYEKVENNQIADPGKSALLDFRLLGAANGKNTFMRASVIEPEEGASNPPNEENTPSPTQEPVPGPTEGAETPPPAETPDATPAETPVVTASAAPTTIPTATPTATVTPTPTATATPTPTATVTPTPTATPTATPNSAKTDTKSTLKTTSGETLYIKKSDGSFVEAKYADYYTHSEFYRKITKTTGEYRYTGWQTIDGVTYFFDKNGNKVTGDQVIQGAQYRFNSDGSLNNSSGHLGIDVSKYNGNIDWNAVKNSGVSYVIIRCGYRGSTTGALIEDPMFRSNIQGAAKAGLKVGVYFFTQATSEVEAVEEASMVLNLIRGYNISYPVFLDVEATNGNNGRADGISVSTRTAVCRAFCQTIQNSGYKAGIYANKTWFNEKIDAPSLTNYKIWLAQYAAAPSYSRTKYDMWQYSSKGKVSGISGNVDMNISYMGY